jgi:hypothetical protein
MKKKILTSSDLLEDDILLYVDCPVLTRIVKKITSRSVMFHDGSSISIRCLDARLADEKFEVTRNGELIYPY